MHYEIDVCFDFRVAILCCDFCTLCFASNARSVINKHIKTHRKPIKHNKHFKHEKVIKHSHQTRQTFQTQSHQTQSLNSTKHFKHEVIKHSHQTAQNISNTKSSNTVIPNTSNAKLSNTINQIHRIVQAQSSNASS